MKEYLAYFFKILFAALLVLGFFFLFTNLLFAALNILGDFDKWPRVAQMVVYSVILPILFFGAIYLVWKIDNYKKTKSQNFPSVEELENAGLLQRDHFRVLRAFQVDEFDDEGPHYFIELEDKRVLFLSGQYIMEYEGYIDGDINEPRTFPCVEFEILRNRSNKDAMQILCLGAVIEPECLAPPFTPKDKIPQDGEIISDRSYDEIRREFKK